MKLSVNLVTWNGEKYIPYLFESLRKQSFRDWELLVIDNNSTDGTVEAIQKELINFPVSSRVILNKENLGFAAGHNQAYSASSSEYFAIINQDLYLEPECLEKLVEFLETKAIVAVSAPRTMKWRFAEIDSNGFREDSDPPASLREALRAGRLKQSLSNTVDSLGLKVFRSRRVVEIGEGQEYHQKANGAREVFGVSGAIAIFRRSAIDQVGFFDESFNSYKEDVDLAYRLQSAGWKSYVLLDAVAYHDRSGGGTKHKDDFSSAQNKNNQSPLVRYHSYKNHLAVLYKNEYWQNFLIDLPWIKWYELKKFVYFLLFDRSVLKGLGELWMQRGGLRAKRASISKLRKVDWKHLRKWWV